MRIIPEITELMIKFKIKYKMENSFQEILLRNTTDELAIENKNISINTKDIEYSKSELNWHRFQTRILNDCNNEIDYFALVVTNENEQIDEYFVINQ